MHPRDIMRVYFVLLVITNSYFASGLKCYNCVDIRGDPEYTDPNCRTLDSSAVIERSPEQDKKLEKAAEALQTKLAASSGRQDGAACVTFVGTFDGKSTVFRAKLDGPAGCFNYDEYVDFNEFGRRYVIGEACLCKTDGCNKKPFGGTGNPRPPGSGGGGGGGGQGSLAGRTREQKLSFVVTLQLVCIANKR